MDQFPSLILCHLPNQLTDVALLAIGQDQVGAVLACGKEQRAQQILMVRVHHQCKLMGQHLVAVITGIACRVIYLQSQGNHTSEKAPCPKSFSCSYLPSKMFISVNYIAFRVQS